MSKRHSIRIEAKTSGIYSRVFLDGELVPCVVAVRVDLDVNKDTRVVLTLEPDDLVIEGDDLQIEAVQPL